MGAYNEVNFWDTKKLDRNNRVVIPTNLRKILNVKQGDDIQFSVLKQGNEKVIIIKKAK